MKDSRNLFKVTFAKKGQMRYISHLDLMRLFHRAARRADTPLEFSQGFNPRPKISFKRALKLGLESEAEEAIFSLNAMISVEEFKSRLQKQLPEGVVIKKIEGVN